MIYALPALRRSQYRPALSPLAREGSNMDSPLFSAGQPVQIVRFHIGNRCNAAYRSTRRNRKAVVITETDDRLIAAAAIMGDSNMPVTG